MTAGLVLLFAATIDRFELLKGLGVEAKTRQLDEKLEQADEALRRLRELAELTGATLINLNSNMGRWDSAPTPSNAYAFAQRIRSMLNRLGSDASTVHAALTPFGVTMCRDLAVALTRPLDQAMQKEIERLEAELMKIPRPINTTDENFIRLNSARTAAYRYRDEKLRQFPNELDAYPDEFLSIFDNVPLADKRIVEASRTKAQRFVAGMRSMRESLTLTDPPLGFMRLTRHRSRVPVDDLDDDQRCEV